MEQDLQKQIQASRKGMGDYTRIILAFYACLMLLGFYQQYRLYSEGVLDSLASRNLIILSAHHLGFTALLSLFLYFSFNALEALKPRYGLYFSGIVLAGVLFIETGLTAYFLAHYEMPEADLQVLSAIFNTSDPNVLTASLLLLLTGMCFYGLYKWSAPFQQWMGRVYPFTLAIFSLFLATMLERSQPLSENKTKYFIGEWFENTLQFNVPPNAYAYTPIEFDPLVGIYRQEKSLIREAGKNEPSSSRYAMQTDQNNGMASFLPEQYSQSYDLRHVYSRPEKKEWLQIQSAVPGTDLDRAFTLARDLAHRGERQRAMDLCRYILAEIPDYADAEILLGRILAWGGDFAQSESVLDRAIAKHPHYGDAYGALLDTYFWSGQWERSISLAPVIRRNVGDLEFLNEKLERAQVARNQELLKNKAENKANPGGS